MTPEGELDQNTKTSLANQKTLTMLTLVAPKIEARALKVNALQAMYKPFKPADCPEGLNRGEPGEREGGRKQEEIYRLFLLPPTYSGFSRGTKHTIRNVKILGGGRKQHREDKLQKPLQAL